MLLALRSQRHLGEPVPDGPVRDGGLGLAEDPAAPLHGAHGGPGLPAAAGAWGRDLHEGECLAGGFTAWWFSSAWPAESAGQRCGPPAGTRVITPIRSQEGP